MSNTPNLGLELVPSNSFQPWVQVNDALQVLDALVQLTVQDKDAATPPTTVSGDAGKRWIIGASPTGAWAGQAGAIALCTGANLWRIIPSKDGFEAWVIDEAKKYRKQSGTWTML